MTEKDRREWEAAKEEFRREWKNDDDRWWTERSLPVKILMGIGFGILGVGAIFGFGWIVMLLWNWLMPEIFGLTVITYWQAWGLMILSCILFKGFKFGSDSGSSRHDRRRRRELKRFMEDQPTESESTTSENEKV